MLDRREFLSASAVVPFLATIAQGEPVKLASAVLDPAAAKLTRASFGDVRVYFDGPTDQLHAMTGGMVALKPGMVPHPPHQHPEEEIMLVTEGSGEITIDGTPHSASRGSMMYCSGGRMHGITAGPDGLTFYYFKWRT